MEHTEKTLALLLVAAIVVSLGGTIVSLNKLGQIELKTLTGKATDSQPGYVQLNITSDTNKLHLFVSVPNFPLLTSKDQ